MSFLASAGLLAASLVFLLIPTGSYEQAHAEIELLTATRHLELDNFHTDKFDVRIGADQSSKNNDYSTLSVLAFIVSLNDTAENEHFTVGNFSVFDSMDNRYPATTERLSRFDSINSGLMVNSHPLPLAIPAGGGLEFTLDMPNATAEAVIDLTFVYVANSQNKPAVIDIIPAQSMPYDVIENYQSLEISPTSAGNQTIEIDNGFTDPESHCEACTKVAYHPGRQDGVDVAFVVNATDLSSSDSFSFWAKGEGEVNFSVAGKRAGNNSEAVDYQNSVRQDLDDQWRRIEIDLQAEGNNDDDDDLSSITHLFGFSLEGSADQTFYLKGMTYD